MWRSVRVWHQQFILKIWCMRLFWFKRLINTNCQVKYVLLPCWAWDGFSFNCICISISKVIYTRFKISKNMNGLIIEYVWRTHILILFPECSKAVTYDERPKKKRDNKQKSSLFPRKGPVFCWVSLFIFGRLSYVTAISTPATYI